jgi:hypothetical protein
MKRAAMLLPILALLGACGDGAPGPTAPDESHARTLVSARSAPVTSASCDVFLRGEQYDVSVSWSRIPTTALVLTFGIRNVGGLQIDLAHLQRTGTLSRTLDFLPDHVVFMRRGTETAQQSCVVISS